MQNLFAEVEEELPLTLERETDCRETWPKRWALLKAKVEKIYNTQLESQIAALKAELAQQTNNKQSTPFIKCDDCDESAEYHYCFECMDNHRN